MSVGGALPQDMHRGGLDLPMGSWSEPPRDVLDCILDKLKEHRDVPLFSSVCAAWRSFTLENLQRFPRQLPLARCLPQQCQLPLLMLNTTKSSDFFCVFGHKFYGGTPLPDSNKWIWGSSMGWLVTADIRGPEIYLFNPITRDQIYLPSKTEIPQPKCDADRSRLETFYYLSKAALSKSPASNIQDCAVMAIISTYCVLSFCRLGDIKWTNVIDSPIYVDDINYYKEQFYAVNMYGVAVVFDTGPSPKAIAVVEAPNLYIDDEHPELLFYKKRYLVESHGELLQVVRMLVAYGAETNGGTFQDYRTVGFQVFKLQEKGSEDDADEAYASVDGKFLGVEDSSYK